MLIKPMLRGILGNLYYLTLERPAQPPREQTPLLPRVPQEIKILLPLPPSIFCPEELKSSTSTWKIQVTKRSGEETVTAEGLC